MTRHPIIMKGAISRFDQLAERLAEVYARNFSVDEIHDLVAFYRSPIGQKFVERQSTIANESVALGQEFGREINTDLKEQMANEMKKRKNAN